MTGKLLLATILCLMGGSALGDAILEGNYNVTAFCTAVKPGTQLGSIESCNYYYVCSSSGPTLTNCQSGYAYDYAKSTCAPASQVNCYWGVDNPCAGKNGTWVPNTKVCGGYYYCLNGASTGTGKCPTGQRFDSTSSQCVYGSCNLIESDEPSLTSLCEVVPPGIYFGDTESCSAWNYCQATTTGVTLQTGSCTTNNKVAFNAATGSCDYTSTSICSRVTGNPLSEAAAGCTDSGAVKASTTVCGQYYVCKNQQWTGVACTTNYYFDVTSKSCQPRQIATPGDGCNRCQYATTKFVNAVDNSNCANYYYCNSDGVGSLVSCPKSYYFDEERQGCVSDESLSSYASKNGACKGATAETTTTDASTTTDDGTGTTGEETKTTEDDTKTTEDDTKTTEDDTKTTEDDTKTTEDDTKTTEDDTKTTEDDTKTTEDDTKTTEDDTKTTEDDTKTTEDDTKTTEDDTKTTEDDTKTTEDDTKTTE